MSSISDRITAIINAFNLNNFAFSKRIGVTGTTIDSIVNGRPQPDGSRKKTKPGYDVLLAIIDEFDINPDYLFGLSDVMLRSDIPTYPSVPQVISTNEHGKENIVLVSIKARAGYLSGYGDLEFIDSLPSFKMPQLKHGTYRCFEIQGHSMDPGFFDGDFVFGKYIEQLSDIKDHQVYIIVSKNNGVVLKRVLNLENEETLLLQSDNKDGNYPDYSIGFDDILEVWSVQMYASKYIPKSQNMISKLFELEDKISRLEHKVQAKTKS